MYFGLFYQLDFLVFYDRLVGRMAATARNVEVLMVGLVVIFFVIELNFSFDVTCIQQCNKD